MEAEYLNMQLDSVDGLFNSLPSNTCIKTLNLHYNLLQDVQGLKNMHSYVKSITEINVSSNRLNNTSNLNDLTYLFDLTLLDLSGNHYTSLDALPYLPSLEVLHVAYNPIKTLENIHRNCPNITKLDIRNICLPSYYDETILIKPLNDLKLLHTLLITGSAINAGKVNINMPSIIMNIMTKCQHIQYIDNISCIEWMENNKPMVFPSTSPIPILPPRSPTIIVNNQLNDDEKESISVNEAPVVVVNTPRFDQIAQRFRNKQTHKELNSSIIYSRHNDHDNYRVELDETAKVDSGSEKSIEHTNNSCFNIDDSHVIDIDHANYYQSDHDTEEEVTVTKEYTQLVNTGVQTISFDQSVSSTESNRVNSPIMVEYIDEATSPLIISIASNDDSSLLVSIDNNPCAITSVNNINDEPQMVWKAVVMSQATQTTDGVDYNQAQQRLFQRQLRLQKLLLQRQNIQNVIIGDAFHTLKWNSIIHRVTAEYRKSQEIMQSKSLLDRREAVDSVSRRVINQESLNMTLRKEKDKVEGRVACLEGQVTSQKETITGLEGQVTSLIEMINGLELRVHDVTTTSAAANAQLSTANNNVISLNKLCNDTMQENGRLQNELEDVKSNYHKIERRFYKTETCFNEATDQLIVANHNNKALMSKFQELTECTKKLQLTLRHYKQLYETEKASAIHEANQNTTNVDGIVDTIEISKRLDSLETVLVQKTKESQQKEKDLNIVIKVKEKMLEDQLLVISSLKGQSIRKNNEIEQLLETVNKLQETVDALNEDVDAYETELSNKGKIVKELRALVHALQQSNQIVSTSISIDEWTHTVNIAAGQLNEDNDDDDDDVGDDDDDDDDDDKDSSGDQ